MRIRNAVLVPVLVVGVALGVGKSQAQVNTPISAAFLQGLVNVNVQDVANNLNNVVVVDVNHVNVLNNVAIDVLRNGVIEVLSRDANFLNNWNVLNDTLRRANLINNNQVAIGIGVLTGAVPIILVDRRAAVRP